MYSSTMDLVDIKCENSFLEQSSRSECPSPLEGANSSSFSRLDDLRSKIISGQIKLKEKRGRSRVWIIFATMLDENGEDIEGFVACRSCYKIFKYTNCTSNLVRHKCFTNNETKENGNKNGQEVEVDRETKNKLSDAAAQWLVTNCRPFSILEDAGLKNMARIFLSVGATFGEKVNIDHIIPKSITVEKNISELYELQRQIVATELNKIKCTGYSITTYVWTDSFLKRPFISVTIHYIKQSVVANHLLIVSPLNSDLNTGYHIKEKVRKCLRKFDCDLEMDDPIIVTDIDVHFIDAFKQLHHINCINTLLNNTIEKAFKDVSELRQLLDRCIRLVKISQKSGDNLCLQSSINPAHRNTILYYLKTVQDNWQDLSKILLDNSEMPVQIAEIKAIVNILISFEETSQALVKENTPTLHLTIPHIHKLKKQCANTDESITNETIFKNELRLHLDAITEDHISKYHKIALFLFPPTKKLLLFEESERKATIADCKEMMQQCYVETRSTSRKKVKLDIEYCGDSIFSDFLEPTSSDTKLDTINHEINEYLSRKITLSEDFDVLDWWKANKDLFPLLNKVSCKVLGTPASIATAERAILQARNLLNTEPGTMPCAEDMINEIIFLNNNFKYDE